MNGKRLILKNVGHYINLTQILQTFLKKHLRDDGIEGAAVECC